MHDPRIVGQRCGDDGPQLRRLRPALMLLICVIAATPTDATAAPEPTTIIPSEQKYLVTWKITAKGGFERDYGTNRRCELDQSSATEGTAIVRFKSGMSQSVCSAGRPARIGL